MLAEGFAFEDDKEVVCDGRVGVQVAMEGRTNVGAPGGGTREGPGTQITVFKHQNDTNHF